jgi:DNA-binding SARP family transcriptional activator
MRPDENAVFIAYARSDSQFVLELATALRAAGANVWVDQLDISPGTRWDQTVEEALDCCGHVLVVLSPAAVESPNVLDEISYALEAHKEIIPVLHKPCQIPLRLRRFQYIDLTGSYDAGLQRLLASLGVKAPAQPAEPVAPVSQAIGNETKRAEYNSRVGARLRLFGGVSLEGEHGPIAGRGAQRRRLALLAILATVRRGISRDKLIGYLWEEADTERARRVLSEAIYVIRKSLGEDAIIASGDEVRLNPQVVSSDVAEFSDALDASELERAVELYNGPFLDGFFLADALEFDQWAERERQRLAHVYADALQSLADRADAAGDRRSAVRWWRKLTEHDRYGAARIIGLMRALDGAGDRAAALQEARAYASAQRSGSGARSPGRSVRDHPA